MTPVIYFRKGKLDLKNTFFPNNQIRLPKKAKTLKCKLEGLALHNPFLKFYILHFLQYQKELWSKAKKGYIG